MGEACCLMARTRVVPLARVELFEPSLQLRPVPASHLAVAPPSRVLSLPRALVLMGELVEVEMVEVVPAGGIR